MTEQSIEQRIDRLQAGGVIDMHFDLPMDLYEKRDRENVLETEFLAELETANIGVAGAAIHIEDRYLPDAGLCVALDQIAWLFVETQACPRFAQIGTAPANVGPRPTLGSARRQQFFSLSWRQILKTCRL